MINIGFFEIFIAGLVRASADESLTYSKEVESEKTWF